MTLETPSITPVLLCGGAGTRLWPLSRKSYPKQFAPMLGQTTLFQAAISRVSGPAFADPLILTSSDFRFIVAEQMMEMGQDPNAILLEPSGRNTAPAILAAALYLARTDPDALMLVAPSDHDITDTEAFCSTVMAGVEAAASGQMVTFGIQPDRPETGYGYLELEETPKGDAARPYALSRFVEKPDAAQAQQMLDEGHYLWNAGIFMFSAKTMIAAFETHQPAMLDHVRAAVEQAKPDLGFLRLDTEAWHRADDISIDYAVMEHADNLVVVPFTQSWSDLGGWDAVWRASAQDETAVATAGNVTAIDCSNSLLRSEDSSIELVGMGLDNIIAIAMKDAVLVADMNRSQDVKLAVSELKARGAAQAETFPIDHRPWGWFESLVIGERFQVKRIVVTPGASLSLQSHHHRSEHWIVVEGTARVTVDDKVTLVSENQSVYIPLGAVHRMENPGKVNMVLIEVQTGSYLGEDDIIRYEDVYSRS